MRLQRTTDDDETRAEIVERMRSTSEANASVQSNVSEDDLVHRFRTLLTEGSTGNSECSVADLGSKIKEYLRERQAPLQAVVAPADAIERYELASSALEMRTGAMVKEDLTSITEAICGVAETGSVLLASSPKFPSLASFVVQTHIVLVRRKNIVATLEDSLDELRRQHVRTPRHCVWVTGASSTGDIDMRLIIGAQGPRTLQVFIVD